MVIKIEDIAKFILKYIEKLVCDFNIDYFYIFFFNMINS